MPRFTFKGDKAMLRELDKMSDVIQHQGKRNAVIAGALLVANAAKRLAHIITGTLRRSIHVGGAADNTHDFKPGSDIGEYSELDKPEEDKNTITALVGTNLDYAREEEFGGGNRLPHPFLRPALDENHNEIAKEMQEVLQDVIRRGRATRS